LNKTFELIFRILDDLVRALVANYEQDDVETKFLVPQKNLFISLM
jgi:predicted Mrr-cat superfamily restriction endonuclease